MSKAYDVFLLNKYNLDKELVENVEQFCGLERKKDQQGFKNVRQFVMFGKSRCSKICLKIAVKILNMKESVRSKAKNMAEFLSAEVGGR